MRWHKRKGLSSISFLYLNITTYGLFQILILILTLFSCRKVQVEPMDGIPDADNDSVEPIPVGVDVTPKTITKKKSERQLTITELLQLLNRCSEQ